MAARQNTKKPRYAIVRAVFNAPITKALLEGALRAFEDAGIDSKQLNVVEVPGAFELPVAALWLAQSKKYAAIVALGCVIRGETPHFDIIAGEAARGLQDVAVKTGVPVAFGVLTTENEAQARARASREANRTSDHAGETGRGNKGYEAAQVALEMAKTIAAM